MSIQEFQDIFPKTCIYFLTLKETKRCQMIPEVAMSSNVLCSVANLRLVLLNLTRDLASELSSPQISSFPLVNTAKSPSALSCSCVTFTNIHCRMSWTVAFLKVGIWACLILFSGISLSYPVAKHYWLLPTVFSRGLQHTVGCDIVKMFII